MLVKHKTFSSLWGGGLANPQVGWFNQDAEESKR